MSNFTHIPRHPRDGFSRHNNNQPPKYNLNRKRRYEQIGEAKTVYDRSDRYYTPRYGEHVANRITRKGIFGNRKKSFVVMKDLSSTVRRREYHYRRNNQPRREEHNQHYDQRRPRSNTGSQECYYRRDQEVVRQERSYNDHRRPRSNAGSQEHYRKDQQSGREERSRQHSHRPKYERKRDDDRNISRDSGQSSLPRRPYNEQMVTESQEPHHRREQQPRKEERRHNYDNKTPDSMSFERRKGNDTKFASDSGLASLVRALPSSCDSPHLRSANSKNSGSKYPAKLIRDRILFAVPRISLRDDDHDKYGATTQTLLHGSLRGSRQGNLNHGNSGGHCDLLNRTAVLDYHSDEPEPRYAAHDENIFQSEFINLSQQLHRPPTPEIERQFNQTIADEFRVDENYLNKPPSPFLEGDEFNASVLFNGSYAERQPRDTEEIPPSPGDAQLLKQLNELANPPFSQSFNLGSLF